MIRSAETAGDSYRGFFLFLDRNMHCVGREPNSLSILHISPLHSQTLLESLTLDRVHYLTSYKTDGNDKKHVRTY